MRFRQTLFLHGLKLGLPIVAGYIPVALAFGLVSRASDLPLTAALGFSLFVFAGASQFIAVELLRLGAGAPEIIITTLLVNFRHFLMSGTLASRMHGRTGVRPVLAFGVTDESFAVSATKMKRIYPEALFGVELLPYLAWSGGTAAGFLMGSLLPAVLQNALGITLYALFIVLLVPEVLRHMRIGLVAACGAGVNAVLSLWTAIPSGVALVAAIVAGAACGFFLEGRTARVANGAVAEAEEIAEP